MSDVSFLLNENKTENSGSQTHFYSQNDNFLLELQKLQEISSGTIHSLDTHS